jgi:hypothetical protein
MNKYERAVELMQGNPLGTLGETVCCVTKDEPRWMRLIHPTFTLDLRLDAQGNPQLVAPAYLVSEEERIVILAAVEQAIRFVSDGEIGLCAFMASIQISTQGLDVLRSLMPLRVVHGSLLQRVRNPNPPSLRVA